jgi:hypothetical protein
MTLQKNALKVGIFVLQHNARLLEQLELFRHAKVEVATVVINEGAKRQPRPTNSRIHKVFRDIRGITTMETVEHIIGILERRVTALFGARKVSKPSFYDREVRT